jgi:hypothetical protein
LGSRLVFEGAGLIGVTGVTGVTGACTVTLIGIEVL